MAHKPGKIAVRPSSAVLVLFGKGRDGKSRAGRFPSAMASLAIQAAGQQQVPFFWVEGPDAKALARQVPEGRIDAHGRGTLPAIKESLFKRLQAFHQVGAGTISYPRTWDEIRVGSLVIAQDESEPLSGWWEAYVIAAEGDSLTLIWRDDSDPDPFTRHRLSVARLDPDAHAQPTSAPGSSPEFAAAQISQPDTERGSSNGKS